MNPYAFYTAACYRVITPALSTYSHTGIPTATMKFFSNLPDSDHVPYKFLVAEPHFKQVVKYMRTEDYIVWGSVATLFPLATVLWERSSPTLHPRYMPRIMAVSIPVYFIAGFVVAAQMPLYRFWGWKENGIEATRWEAEQANAAPPVKKGWSDADW
ncbi:hypothetical protein SmJEL517_g05137 [Synchytrium microbalum]|uniref:NADH-ubiquinone oxidoreductase 21kDa subunit N-terminal domain-containing protein n=1 Tax=Synchytrium microbalum TaxID=1806994 RepID=A0A507BQP5_9FUNG|nr:uncharacterized protein SmJEL517_g05137 [Synchytrium microbalum]TPX31517.1 hypothetical protein SmJEL517_g05137 [Synchytrium microbalum]